MRTRKLSRCAPWRNSFAPSNRAALRPWPLISVTCASNSSAKRAAPSWRCPVINLLIAAAATFVGLFILVPLLLAVCRLFGLYTIVQERQCKVYMLFGKVVLVLKDPGLYLLWSRLTWRAPLVHWIGRSYTLE